METAYTVDAGPIIEERRRSSVPPISEGEMPVDRDSNCYNMSHPSRGHAVIFNNETFDNDLDPRDGSEKDVRRLRTTYEMLGFKVTVYLDRNCSEIKEIIQKLSESDHSNCDCLLVTILTHGFDSGFLSAKDHVYSFDSVWQCFTNDNCLSLAGKPKIFIVQACRGGKTDPGTNLRRFSMTDSAPTSYRIPTMADFIFAYSSVPGFVSWRDHDNGSWFIESLCLVLKEEYEKLDFLKMLTRVSLKVATLYMSEDHNVPSLNEKKQVPNIVSTLIRDIYFTPKES